jgi:GNAT superfamily N-acetyltransferase
VEFAIRSLDAATWPEFASLVERHGGVFGGCWCMGFHAEMSRSAEGNRAAKLARVRAGTSHAALVFDGATCVGWCQFGAPAELPRIKLRRAYEEAGSPPPDWRITCFFVDRAYRHRGVARAALQGALDAIAGLGGGAVESYPQEDPEHEVAGRFLYNATLGLFAAAGFERVHRLGKNHWVVRRVLG